MSSVERATLKAPTVHLDHVDGMRALAALVVFVNHAYGQVWEGDQIVPDPKWPFSLAVYSLVLGHLSVTVFITVSGFCLALPVAAQGGMVRGGVTGFLKRRARRILPPYYAAVALCLALIATVIGEPTGSLWDVALELRADWVISHLLLVQDVFGTGRINYVFWSIATEWHIYFLFPIIVWSWKRYGPGVSVTAALVLGYAMTIGLADTRIVRANPHYLGIFALGMLAAFIVRASNERYERARDRPPWLLVTAVLLLATGLSIAALGIDEGRARIHLLDMLVGILTFAALIASSRSQASLLTRALAWRPLVFIGTFSYSLYLIHAPFLQIIWQYVLRPMNVGVEAMFLWLMSAGLAVILGVSYLFHLAFEAPFMRPAARRSAAEAASVAAP